MGKIKIILSEVWIVIFNPFWWLLCKIRRIRFDFSWRFYGMPYIKCSGIGSCVTIGKRFRACSSVVYNEIGVNQPVLVRTSAHGARIEIGNDVGLSGCTISAAKSIKVGSNVLIGSGALIMDSDAHALDPNDRRSGGKGAAKEIVIEDEVFIGARAIVLKGVKIGKGAIIGAGSVITKDVAPFTVVAGNPARVVKRLKDC